jgi:HAD superfamily hydrolase (TIGR01509 family)
MHTVIQAVIFDLDGVLLDSEQVWNAARRDLTIERGGEWREGATEEMMGMSSHEWSRYMHDHLAVALSPEKISAAVMERVESLYLRHLPLLPGAVEAVNRMAARWRLGLASSSNLPVIHLALDLMEVRGSFEAVVSSEEVAHGKPRPDVYLEAARRLGIDPRLCAAVEDSRSGILAAKGARMRVLAVPNRAFPPDEAVLAQADVVLDTLAELDATIVEPSES